MEAGRAQLRGLTDRRAPAKLRRLPMPKDITSGWPTIRHGTRSRYVSSLFLHTTKMWIFFHHLHQILPRGFFSSTDSGHLYWVFKGAGRSQPFKWCLSGRCMVSWCVFLSYLPVKSKCVPLTKSSVSCISIQFKIKKFIQIKRHVLVFKLQTVSWLDRTPDLHVLMGRHLRNDQQATKPKHFERYT